MCHNDINIDNEKIHLILLILSSPVIMILAMISEE